MRSPSRAAGAFIKSAPEKDIPDIQIHYVSMDLRTVTREVIERPPSTPLVVWFIFVALKAVALLG